MKDALEWKRAEVGDLLGGPCNAVDKWCRIGVGGECGNRGEGIAVKSIMEIETMGPGHPVEERSHLEGRFKDDAKAWHVGDLKEHPQQSWSQKELLRER